MILSIKTMTYRLSCRAVVGVVENTQLWRFAIKFGGDSYRIPPCFAVCGRSHHPEGSSL